MSWVLIAVLAAILLSPLLVKWGGTRTKWALGIVLLALGLFVSLFLFGVEGRIAIKNSSLTGEELNAFAQGVSALSGRIWVERALVSAIIVALFSLAVIGPRNTRTSVD